MDSGWEGFICSRLTAYLALFLFALAAKGQTQQTSGRVKDAAGRPVVGASVTGTCGAREFTAASDAAGEFVLDCAASSVRVEARGFAEAVYTGAPSIIVLRASAVQEQVTVTATRASGAAGETGRTAYVLDAADLHNYPSVTLDEGLRQHAGFELFRRASSRVANPTSEGISLRGLGSTAASRTLVLEDGAPLNDPFGGWVHWDEAPQQTIDSVTLVSGGGSDLYGSSALGGVVDVVPVTADSTRFEVSGAGGSQATNDLQATVSGAFRPVGALLAGQSMRSAGYRLVDPAIAGLVDTAANVQSQAFRGEVGRRDFSNKRLFLTGNVLNEDRGNGTPVQTNATRLWRYLAGYDSPETNRGAGRVRLFGSDEGYRQSFSSIASDRNSEALTRLQRVHTQELGASADATLHLGAVAAVVGADVRDIRGDDDETPIAKGSPNGLQAVTARQRFAGGFGELLGEQADRHGAWSGALSLRADVASNLDIAQTTRTLTNATEAVPPNRSEVVLSPRLGVVRSFGSVAEVHASGFRAFRSPSMNELYRTGQVGQEITLANASLNSERATGWEVGTRLPGPGRGTELQATYFWTEINRPVSAVLVSQTATTITEERENLGQIRSRGVEVALQIHAGGAVSGTVGYQYAEATVMKFSAQPSLVGNWIPQVPRHSFTAQMRATRARWGEVTLAVRASGMAFDDSANSFVLKRFLDVDLSGHRALTPRLDMFFLAQNLTDQRAQVARTPVLTLGSPIFVEGGVRFRLGQSSH